MSNLNLDLNYFEHPKIRRLVGLLGHDAEIFPIRLWCYCGLYHTDDGVFSGYSVQEIEGVAKWNGEPGTMVKAMVQVGLLDKTGKNYGIHDWQETNGHLIAFKIRAKTAAEKRWGTSNATSNAKCTPKQSPNQPTIPTKPTIPSFVPEDLPSELTHVPNIITAWMDFEEHWKEIKKPLTPRSRKELWSFLSQQADPVAVIRQSIRNGWRGLFELKENGNGAGQRTGYGQGGKRETFTEATVARLIKHPAGPS